MKSQVIVLGVFLLGLTACGKSVNRDYIETSTANSTADDACDPLDGQPISTQQLFKGTLALLPTGTSTTGVKLDSFWDTNTDGTLSAKRSGNLDLYTNQLFVPNRLYSSGFPISTSTSPIMNPDDPSAVLTEWFSLKFETHLVLGNKTPGKYYIGSIADDGIEIEIDTGTGFRTLALADGIHAEYFACPAVGDFIELDSNSKIPLRITYFQGPKNQIALLLLMKKVEDTDIALPVDSDCSKTGSSYWFNASTALPTANWMALMARGWESLSQENLFLDEGLKSCN